MILRVLSDQSAYRAADLLTYPRHGGSRLRQTCCHRLTDRRGSVTVITALCLTALIGIAALAMDASSAYAERTVLQQIADGAALAGALAYKDTSNTSVAVATIQDSVQANGWPTSIIQSGATGYLAHSPQTESNSAIQVKLTTAMPTHLINLISSLRSLQISVYSLVEMVGTQESVCMLSLTTIIVNSSVDLASCGMAANSAAASAILVNGGGTIAAALVTAAGSITNNGTINAPVSTNAPAVADPFASDRVNASSGFQHCQNPANGQTILSAGCWSNVNVNSGTTLALGSGTFFFTSLNVNSNASLVATGGTTIILENNFSPSGNITITAPTSGSWAGIAVYAMGGMNINSGVTYDINGAIYSPSGALIPNSGTWNQTACTEIIAQSIIFNAGSTFTLPRQNCSAYGFPIAAASGGVGTIALRR